MPGTVARVESHCTPSVWIKWILAFALTVCLVPSPASAQTEKEPDRSQWTYFDKNNQALGCFSTDIAAANAVIAHTGACGAAFSNWETPWPNGDAVTDQFQVCPPPEVPTPDNWALQHWEDRTAKWTYQSPCGGSSQDSTSLITRHFLYYCEGDYTLTTLSSVPTIAPICRIKEGKPVPAKQTRGCCASLGATSVGDPIDVATGNIFQRETDYRGNGFAPLLFERQYNSSGDGDGSLGANWRHTYSRSIERIGFPSPRDRCVNAVNLRLAACMSGGRNPIVCHTQWLFGLMFCNARSDDSSHSNSSHSGE